MDTHKVPKYLVLILSQSVKINIIFIHLL